MELRTSIPQRVWHQDAASVLPNKKFEGCVWCVFVGGCLGVGGGVGGWVAGPVGPMYRACDEWFRLDQVCPTGLQPS